MIGISPQEQESGTALFVPLTAMHAVLTGMPADASDFWVRTTSYDHAFIDRTTTRIEDTLTAHGYDVTSEIVYARLADETAGYRTVTTTLAAVGLLVVAIGLAGLANALTMSVLERSREIGILRSIGARARDIRRIFAAETLTLAAAGWVIGIPLGYLLDRFLVWVWVRRSPRPFCPRASPSAAGMSCGTGRLAFSSQGGGLGGLAGRRAGHTSRRASRTVATASSRALPVAAVARAGR